MSTCSGQHVPTNDAGVTNGEPAGCFTITSSGVEVERQNSSQSIVTTNLSHSLLIAHIMPLLSLEDAEGPAVKPGGDAAKKGGNSRQKTIRRENNVPAARHTATPVQRCQASEITALTFERRAANDATPAGAASPSGCDNRCAALPLGRHAHTDGRGGYARRAGRHCHIRAAGSFR